MLGLHIFMSRMTISSFPLIHLKWGKAAHHFCCWRYPPLNLAARRLRSHPSEGLQYNDAHPHVLTNSQGHGQFPPAPRPGFHSAAFSIPKNVRMTSSLNHFSNFITGFLMNMTPPGALNKVLIYIIDLFQR